MIDLVDIPFKNDYLCSEFFQSFRDREIAMTIEEHIAYWKTLAESDLEFARQLLEGGKRLHYCLFFGHLSLEKLLKGLVVAATHDAPPKIHDLVRLSELAKINTNEDLLEKLKTFNSFNLEARYPDYKLSFYKLCTPEFTTKNFSQIEEVYQWLEGQFPSQSSPTSKDSSES